jgi:uncharacterized surface protein with fasciclin (FAS1) repeats
MRISRRAAVAAAGAVLAVGATSALTAPAASAAPAAPAAALTAAPAAASTHSHLGTRSLVTVLLADKKGFDRNSKDFDILTAAVKAVLAAKPHSAVGVLANGKVPLTAFIPNDGAFRRLVRDLTGKNLASESAVFKAVASLGIHTVEQVLLYHVVPGVTITSGKALRSNGAILKTAQGGTIKVRVVHRTLYLQDKDPNATNPKGVIMNINIGNRQIAHAIDRVLRPVDLPPLARH